MIQNGGRENSHFWAVDILTSRQPNFVSIASMDIPNCTKVFYEQSLWKKAALFWS